MRTTSARTGAAVIVLAIVAALAPMGARAGVCDHDTVVFSTNTTNPAGGVNPFAAWCVAEGGDEFDSRVIYPGSDVISIRYTQDLGSVILIAHLDGIGFTDRQVELKHFVTATGGGVMDSDDILLPDGIASSGCLNVVIYDKEDTEMLEPLDATVWHTQDKQLGC